MKADQRRDSDLAPPPEQLRAAMLFKPTRLNNEERMTTVKYHVVEHDGGWAYKVGDVFSEAFPTHDEARRAAEIAAGEHEAPGETTDISWEDERGRWHDETARGDDRPETSVED
jgi:hypothetical protein